MKCPTCFGEGEVDASQTILESKALNERELATVLAALRLYQAWLAGDVRGAGDLAMIDPEPMEVEEIDALCERLNRA